MCDVVWFGGTVVWFGVVWLGCGGAVVFSVQLIVDTGATLVTEAASGTVKLVGQSVFDLGAVSVAVVGSADQVSTLSVTADADAGGGAQAAGARLVFPKDVTLGRHTILSVSVCFSGTPPSSPSVFFSIPASVAPFCPQQPPPPAPSPSPSPGPSPSPSPSSADSAVPVIAGVCVGVGVPLLAFFGWLAYRKRSAATGDLAVPLTEGYAPLDDATSNDSL